MAKKIEETAAQTMEKLVLEMAQSINALPHVHGEPIAEWRHAALSADRVEGQFRVHNQALWRAILFELLAFDATADVRFQVSQRYLRQEDKMGFLWQVTVESPSNNLPEAVQAFRKLLTDAAIEGAQLFATAKGKDAKKNPEKRPQRRQPPRPGSLDAQRATNEANVRGKIPQSARIDGGYRVPLRQGLVPGHKQ